MATTRTSQIFYSDLRSDLAVNPANDDVLTITNEAAIEQSIKNLLQTNFYERVMKPNIGSNIKSLLFELASPHTSYNIKEAVKETIENFEPRADIIDVLVENDEDRHSLNVYITFMAMNAEEPTTFNIVLDRVR